LFRIIPPHKSQQGGFREARAVAKNQRRGSVLVVAGLCVLAGHAPVRTSGAADREALVALSNSHGTAYSRPSSSNTETGSDLFVPVILTAS